ncbi:MULTISPECIES: DUF1206 domain-containing protein [Rhodococcus]|uniref:DUF1206 domain-containing protein n=1 Tax=Rhodococcus TaxID=1827 RepID=UPI0020CCC576|nr:DUF1206 domain-containing protein [Rhodococcus gordoniae]UTT48134.1 DUF1206 domain-containing protein [Rhodococcus gordoniae]
MNRQAPASHGASASADRVAQNGVFEKFARAGYVGSGIVHLLIGYLAIRVAFGRGEQEASQSGAMAELGAQPGGKIALWIAVVVFVMMGLWRFAEAAFGKASEPERPDADTKDKVFDRFKAFCVGVVYLAFAYTAFGFARGSGKSSGEQNAGLTAKLLQSGAGKFVLVVAGLVILGVGAYHVYKGVSKNFVDDLKGRPSTLVERLGVVGYVAKGLAIGLVGVLVIVAVFQADPQKAAGLDGALKTLGSQPFGAVLLVLMGLGIAVYGLYSFVMARDAKM